VDLVRRPAWGAAEPTGRPVPIAAPVKHLFLHHSAGPGDDAAAVRAIQQFHQRNRGWVDIAYTWLYSPTHRVFYEGRGPGVHGAHTRGHNGVGHAVCVLGNYETDLLPTTAIRDLAAWAEWHRLAGWGPASYTPHRKVGTTACPGRNIMAVLDTINALANDEQPEPLGELGPGRPTRLTEQLLREAERRDDVDWDAWERYLERPS